jgi:hypothetical protein
MLFASVFKAILVFIVRKSRVLWKTSTIRVRRTMRAIIPFIPLTADLKNGHEESVN